MVIGIDGSSFSAQGNCTKLNVSMEAVRSQAYCWAASIPVLPVSEFDCSVDSPLFCGHHHAFNTKYEIINRCMLKMLSAWR